MAAEKAFIREVGPRDGLQMVGRILPTDKKLEWCCREAATGVGEIEVTSFVNPKAVPQFADAADVARGAIDIGGFVVAALVPNLRGAEAAFDAGVRHINCVISISDSHNRANINRTTNESIAEFRRIIDAATARGRSDYHVACGLATSFGCTIEGAVSEKRVLDVAEQILTAGADEIILADTVGYGSPRQVGRLCTDALALAGDKGVACHFHDTRGLGLANVTAAIEAGVRAFDSSVAGLGGCPFAPGASGNINTEDCAYLLESMGFDTGIDIERLVKLRRDVESWLPGENFTGSIARAGLPKSFGRPLAAV